MNKHSFPKTTWGKTPERQAVVKRPQTGKLPLHGMASCGSGGNVSFGVSGYGGGAGGTGSVHALGGGGGATHIGYDFIVTDSSCRRIE